MTTPRQLCAALLLFVAASCNFARSSEPTFSQDGFNVRVEAGHLVLENDAPAPVHYVALEEETSALVDLYFDPREWPSIAPGGEERIPYADLMGYTPDATQARVHWWTRGQYGPNFVVDLR